MNDTIAAILSNPALTPLEVQRVLRTGRNSTYNAIKSGEIPSFRVGNNIKIPTSWVRAKLGIREVA